MNHTIIIYGSRYGSTKRYAERLAETTGVEAVAYTEAGDLSGYDRIVFLGALSAGGVTGLTKTVGKMAPRQELIVATVGLADPSASDNIAHIRHSIKSQIPAHFYNESRIFHLRGAIDYGQVVDFVDFDMLNPLADALKASQSSTIQTKNHGN